METATQTTISNYFTESRSPRKPDASCDVIDLTLDDGEPPSKRRKVSPAVVATPTAPKRVNKQSQPAQKSKSSSRSQKPKQGASRSSPADKSKGPRKVTPPQSRKHRSEEREGDNNEDGHGEKEGGEGNGSKRSRNKATRIGPSGEVYTALEEQVLELKQMYPGVLLLIQDGYKYCFFGEDAQVASRELGITCHPKRNFLSASIPVGRKLIHIKKLLARGHKVGVVDQQETAALKKASKNSSGLFKRGLTELMTAATYIDELDSDDITNFASGAYPSLMCLVESQSDDSLKKVKIGVVTVVPSTGDVIYDTFEDDPLRMELETRLAHLRPHELLVSDSSISAGTASVLKQFAIHGQATGGGQTRIERFKGAQNTHSEALHEIEEFYENNIRGRRPPGQSLGETEAWLAVIHGLNPLVLVALSHCMRHMRDFGLVAVFADSRLFQSFHNRHSMLLNSSTLANLEIFRTQEGKEKHSLFWLLNKTKTKFGSRRLKQWVARPLTDQEVLQERISAVEEIVESTNPALKKIQMLLGGLPDLGKGLSSIQYKKCAPKELAKVLTGLKAVSHSLDGIDFQGVAKPRNHLLAKALEALPVIRDPIEKFSSCIRLDKARENSIAELWQDEEKFPKVSKLILGIECIESDLQDHLKALRKLLRRPALQYRDVAGDEYAIEIPNVAAGNVPEGWIRLSKTKTETRFHSVEVVEKLADRAQLKERLAAEAGKAYRDFLGEICESYSELRAAVNALAELDCLWSLAQIASQPEYARPEFRNDGSIEIVAGRHPVAEVARPDPFIPNSLVLGGDSPSVNIITGPNMGGKSSCVRMIALICIMAQIGFYVPAESVSMTPVDSVLTRMGAEDDLAGGQSTFMHELSETSEILRLATDRSLVILDELGRGTSTFDGMAIASSVLEYLTERVKCKTLFITHYPLIAEKLEAKHPSRVSSKHMGFVEEGTGRKRVITFLYTLTGGISPGSYGIECARLAGLPESLLEKATDKAEMMKKSIELKTTGARWRELVGIVRDSEKEGSSVFDMGKIRQILRQVE